MTHRPAAVLQAALPLARMNADQARELLAELGYSWDLVRVAIPEAAGWAEDGPPRNGRFTLREHVLHFRADSGTFSLHAITGPDLLVVSPNGPDIQTIRGLALAEARALYGDDAPLVIEFVGTVHGNTMTRRPDHRFYAEIWVRCLALPEGFLP